MGRKVRMVPPDWVHPVDSKGNHVPLHDGCTLASALEDWDEGQAAWNRGEVEDYSGKGLWKPRPTDVASYADWSGERPDPKDYTPAFPESTATHFMMYEDTSEGTPISPAFATPEELARWLSDNNASAFAGETASYEAWLATIKRGFAHSATLTDGRLVSGVEDLANRNQ